MREGTIVIFVCQRQADAKQRQGARNDLKPDFPVNSRESRPSRYEREAATIAARTVGIGGQAVQRAAFVAENAPDMFEEMKRNRASVNEAYKVAKSREAARPKIEPTKPVHNDLRSGRLGLARGEFLGRSL
jgi:hypothetical protein